MVYIACLTSTAHPGCQHAFVETPAFVRGLIQQCTLCIYGGLVDIEACSIVLQAQSYRRCMSCVSLFLTSLVVLRGQRAL